METRDSQMLNLDPTSVKIVRTADGCDVMIVMIYIHMLLIIYIISIIFISGSDGY